MYYSWYYILYTMLHTISNVASCDKPQIFTVKVYRSKGSYGLYF